MTSPAQPAARPGAGRAGSRRARARAVKLVAILAVAAGTAGAGYRERATLEGGLRVLQAHTVPGWIAACVLAQGFTMLCFALLQHRVLTAGGARVTVSWLLSTAYVANGVSVAVPVIGSGMAAAYAYRQLREQRVNAAVAKAALMLSGVVSTVSFAALVGLASVLTGNAAAATGTLVSALICLAVLGTVLVALRPPAGRSRLVRLTAGLLRATRRTARRPRGDPAELAQGALDQLALFRLGFGTVGPAFAWGVLNWAADAACLVLAVKAVGMPIPWGGVLLAWSAGQGAASFSPTPGGIGAVEVAMTAALTAAGLPSAYALAAVLLYRVVSFKTLSTSAWSAEHALSRRRPRAGEAADADAGTDVGAGTD